jgi:hypothetical protein
MAQSKRDPAKVDPLTGAEEQEPAQPLPTVPPGQQPNATSAEIPGTGAIIKDVRGKEARRNVQT